VVHDDLVLFCLVRGDQVLLAIAVPVGHDVDLSANVVRAVREVDMALDSVVVDKEMDIEEDKDLGTDF
jgi:hypothetical protein